MRFQNIIDFCRSVTKFSKNYLDFFRFELTLAYMSILITFQAYGNVTMDCTIVAFYAQAKIQIQMLRYNLEQLVELDDAIKMNKKLNKKPNQYIPYKDEEKAKTALQERLKKCVVHYYKIVRYGTNCWCFMTNIRLSSILHHFIKCNVFYIHYFWM